MCRYQDFDLCFYHLLFVRSGFMISDVTHRKFPAHPADEVNRDNEQSVVGVTFISKSAGIFKYCLFNIKDKQGEQLIGNFHG